MAKTHPWSEIRDGLRADPARAARIRVLKQEMDRAVDAASAAGAPRARLRVVARSFASIDVRRMDLRARARHLRLDGRKVKDEDSARTSAG